MWRARPPARRTSPERRETLSQAGNMTAQRVSIAAFFARFDAMLERGA